MSSFTPDKNGHVSFGDVCRDILGMQCQYGSCYANPYYASDAAKQRGERTPYLAEGLDIAGDPDNYHFLTIQKGDVRQFVSRVVDFKVSNYVWSKENGATIMNRLLEAGF